MYEKRKKNEDLSLKFIFPVTVENIILVISGFIFASVISTVSESALSAIGMADSVLAVVLSFFAILSVGSSVITARFIGANDRKGAEDTVCQTVMLSVTSSIVASALLIAFSTLLMRFLMPTAEDTLFYECVRYFRILMLSFPAHVLYLALNGICYTVNRSKYCLFAGIAMNLSQLLFGWLFISVFGFEEIGAGLAYVACRIVGALILLIVLMHDRTYFSLSFKKFFRFDAGTVRNILHIGMPISVESVFVQLGYVVANSIAVAQGTYEVSCYQIINSMNSLNTAPQTISRTVSINVVGHLLGSGDARGAKRRGYAVWAASVGFTVVLCLIIIIFSREFASFFTSDPDRIEAAASMAWIILVINIAGTSLNAIDAQLRSGGDVKFVMVTALTAIICIKIPLSYVFASIFKWGIMGVFAANAVSLYYRAIIGLIRHSGTRWIKKI